MEDKWPSRDESVLCCLQLKQQLAPVCSVAVSTIFKYPSYGFKLNPQNPARTLGFSHGAKSHVLINIELEPANLTSILLTSSILHPFLSSCYLHRPSKIFDF